LLDRLIFPPLDPGIDPTGWGPPGQLVVTARDAIGFTSDRKAGRNHLKIIVEILFFANTIATTSDQLPWRLSPLQSTMRQNGSLETGGNEI
jgi:hypothetical protein